MIMEESRVLQILRNTKTQTRRLARPGETYVLANADVARAVGAGGIDGIEAVFTAKGRIKYGVGRTYALQPGRGLPSWRAWYVQTTNGVELQLVPDEVKVISPLVYARAAPVRIHIASIWLEDVRNISLENARAEGFTTRGDFLSAWRQMHDNVTAAWGDGLRQRPLKYYQAWALKFEPVAIAPQESLEKERGDA